MNWGNAADTSPLRANYGASFLSSSKEDTAQCRGCSVLGAHQLISLWNAYIYIKICKTARCVVPRNRSRLEITVFGHFHVLHNTWWTSAYIISPIYLQITWQVIRPCFQTKATCAVFCFWSHKSLYISFAPKSLGIFRRAPLCTATDELLMSPCIRFNIIVTSLNISR